MAKLDALKFIVDAEQFREVLRTKVDDMERQATVSLSARTRVIVQHEMVWHPDRHLF